MGLDSAAMNYFPILALKICHFSDFKEEVKFGSNESETLMPMVIRLTSSSSSSYVHF